MSNWTKQAETVFNNVLGKSNLTDIWNDKTEATVKHYLDDVNKQIAKTTDEISGEVESFLNRKQTYKFASTKLRLTNGQVIAVSAGALVVATLLITGVVTLVRKLTSQKNKADSKMLEANGSADSSLTEGEKEAVEHQLAESTK